MEKEKEKLTLRGIIIAIIVAIVSTTIADIVSELVREHLRLNDNTSPAKGKSQIENQKELELQKAVTPEKPEPAITPKHPAMSDKDFLELCESGNARRVEEAIVNGANVNAKDNDGMTVLMLAAFFEHTEVVEVLLKHGADVNAKNNYGWTALMSVALSGNTEVAELLLKHGANVNAKNNNGWTALGVAKSEGHTEIVQLLRRYGAKE